MSVAAAKILSVPSWANATARQIAALEHDMWKMQHFALLREFVSTPQVGLNGHDLNDLIPNKTDYLQKP